jgi:hypothetical protein
MPAGPKNAAAALWGRSALRPVILPSGIKAIVRLPDVNELLKSDAFPEALRSMAGKYAVGGIEINALTPEEIGTFLRLQYELVARTVKYLAPPDSDAWDGFRKGADPEVEGWEAVSLTAAFFAEGDVDEADISALVAIVGRNKTPNEVTIESRADLALALDPNEGGRVSDYAGFRDEPERDQPRDDREDVRPTPVGASRRARSGNRARG